MSMPVLGELGVRESGSTPIHVACPGPSTVRKPLSIATPPMTTSQRPASAHRDPLAVLFYATDDDAAATTIERLIRAAGFEPWKAGGVAAAGRVEAPGGDLHQYGFNGEVVDIDRAKAATAGSTA